MTGADTSSDGIVTSATSPGKVGTHGTLLATNPDGFWLFGLDASFKRIALCLSIWAWVEILTAGLLAKACHTTTAPIIMSSTETSIAPARR